MTDVWKNWLKSLNSELPDPTLLEDDQETLKVIEAIKYAHGSRKERSSRSPSPNRGQKRFPHTDKPIRDFRDSISQRTISERDMLADSDSRMSVDGDRANSGAFYERRNSFQQRFQPKFTSRNADFGRKRTDYHTTKREVLFKDQDENNFKEREFSFSKEDKFKTPAPARGFKLISPLSVNPFKEPEEVKEEQDGCKYLRKTEPNRYNTEGVTYSNKYCSEDCQKIAENFKDFSHSKTFGFRSSKFSRNPFRRMA